MSMRSWLSCARRRQRRIVATRRRSRPARGGACRAVQAPSSVGARPSQAGGGVPPRMASHAVRVSLLIGAEGKWAKVVMPPSSSFMPGAASETSSWWLKQPQGLPPCGSRSVLAARHQGSGLTKASHRARPPASAAEAGTRRIRHPSRRGGTRKTHSARAASLAGGVGAGRRLELGQRCCIARAVGAAAGAGVGGLLLLLTPDTRLAVRAEPGPPPPHPEADPQGHEPGGIRREPASARQPDGLVQRRGG